MNSTFDLIGIILVIMLLSTGVIVCWEEIKAWFEKGKRK